MTRGSIYISLGNCMHSRTPCQMQGFVRAHQHEWQMALRQSAPHWLRVLLARRQAT